MTNAQHTPAPWKVNYHSDESQYLANIHHDWQEGDTNYTRSIAVVLKYASAEETKANADFIVKAVNCHEKLVEALKSFTEWVHDNQENIEWTDCQSLVGIMDNAISVLDDVEESPEYALIPPNHSICNKPLTLPEEV